MAFKVGDRVRLVDGDFATEANGMKNGQEFVVSGICDYNCIDLAELGCRGSGWSANRFELVNPISNKLTPTQITELLHEAEHDIFMAEQRKHDLQAALELVNKGYKVELPNA